MLFQCSILYMNKSEIDTARNVIKFITTLILQLDKPIMVDYKVGLIDLIKNNLNPILLNLIKALASDSVSIITSNYITLFHHILEVFTEESKPILMNIFAISMNEFRLNNYQSEILLNTLFLYNYNYICYLLNRRLKEKRKFDLVCNDFVKVCRGLEPPEVIESYNENINP